MATSWDFTFDDSGDMFLDASGQLAVTQTFEDLVADRIRTKLLTFLGENFLDRESGVPYFGEILIKNPDQTRVRNLLLSVASSVEGVTQVLSFDTEFDVASRTFSINFKVVAGGVVVKGEI